MYQNYLRIALRQLWRHKQFSALNIFGLASSMAVCLLVILVFEDQYGYDKFHTNSDHIYRVVSTTSYEDPLPPQPQLATTALSLAQPLEEDYDFIDKTTPIIHQIGFFKRNNQLLPGTDHGGFFVEEDFLSIFSFDWQSGNEEEALVNPRSIVLSETTAQKFFPDEDPLGQTLLVDILGDFTVTGIISDPPQRSHIQFDYLLSYTSLAALDEQTLLAIGLDDLDNVYRGLVYTQLADGATVDQLERVLAQLSQEYTQRIAGQQYRFTAQSLEDVMPSLDLGNEIGVGTPRIVLRFLLALAALLMLTACFNYTNLTVARSLKRAREIGIRKVSGARRRDIAFQFLSEAVLVALLALGIAIILLELLIPAFYQLDPFVTTVFKVEHSPRAYAWFLLLSIGVGLLAGLLPSINISGFKPLDAMGNLKNVKLFSRVGLRKVLVSTQFTLSFIFILTVIIVLQQQKHILNADLGLAIEDRWSVVLHEHDYQLFAQQIQGLPEVEMVSGSQLVLLTGSTAEATAAYNGGEDSLELSYNRVSANYIDNHDLQLVAGQGFQETGEGSEENFVLLNETAIERMGFASPQQAIGQSITVDTVALSIVGIVKDFHHDNIWFEPIKPFALRQIGETNFSNATIKLKTGYDAAVLATINDKWDQLYPDQPMHSYFVADRVYHMSKFFRMGSRIIGFVGLLTIVISILGLLGMVIYAIEGRIKEVGIRKVLGASISHIIWKLSSSSLLLLTIAIVIGLPITLFAANAWLQNFHLRIEISWWIPMLGIAIMLVLGGITILSQTYLAAQRNPVESLRSE